MTVAELICRGSYPHPPAPPSRGKYCLSGRRKFLQSVVRLACLSGSMLIGLRAHSHSSSRSNDWDVCSSRPLSGLSISQLSLWADGMCCSRRSWQDGNGYTIRGIPAQIRAAAFDWQRQRVNTGRASTAQFRLMWRTVPHNSLHMWILL